MILNLVLVSKEISQYIKSKQPDVHVNQTCRQKSKRKRVNRYIEDTPTTRRLIKEYEENFVKVIYDSRFPEKYKKN